MKQQILVIQKNNTTIENTIDNLNTTTSNPINNTNISNISNNTSNNINTPKTNTVIDNNTNSNTNSNTNNNTNTIAPTNPQKEDDLYLNVGLKETQLRNPLDFYDLVIVEYELPSTINLKEDITYTKTYKKPSIESSNIELSLKWQSIDEFLKNTIDFYEQYMSFNDNFKKSETKKVQINGRKYYYVEFNWTLGGKQESKKYYYTKINDRYVYCVSYPNDCLTESELNKLLNIKVINSL